MLHIVDIFRIIPKHSFPIIHLQSTSKERTVLVTGAANRMVDSSKNISSFTKSQILPGEVRSSVDEALNKG